MILYQEGNSSQKNYYHNLIFEEAGYLSHFHDCFEAMYAMNGQTCFTVDQEDCCLNEGKMCLIMPNQIHSFMPKPGARVWVCVFSPDQADLFRSEIKNRRYPSPIFTPSDTLISLMPDISDARFADLYIQRAFLNLLCHEFHQSVPFIAASQSQTADSNAAHRILTYISEHYSQDVTLDILSRKFGLNRNYISSLINSMTHMNLRTYLNGYRLEQARYMLTHTAKPVTEIAYECGFSSIRTFNRVFTASECCSPRAYRMRHSDSSIAGSPE